MLVQFEITTPVPQNIDYPYLPIYGYYVDTEATSTVSIVLGHKEHIADQSDRGDLFKVFPGLKCKGFYAALEVVEAEETALSVRIGSRTILEQRVVISNLAATRAKDSSRAKSSNREFVLKNLLCPKCKGRLRGLKPPESCSSCGASFATTTRAVSVVDRGTSVPKAINTSFCGFSEEEIDLIASVKSHNGKVLDFGAGLRPVTDETVVSLEIADMPSIDIISTSETIPFADNTFAAAMTLHVLEHVERPWVVAKELIRVVKPGGTILSTVPYICPVHGFPDHFFSMTPAGLKSLFKEHEIVRQYMKPDGHPINGIKQLLSTYFGSIPAGPIRDEFSKLTVDDIVNESLSNLLTKSWAQLNEAALWEMPSHSTLVVKKT
jgi:SAM-dependent methyltransferase